MAEKLYNGWSVRFRPNVHMYCHDLKLSKGQQDLQVSCEDTPSGWVGIWPYSLDLDELVYADLIAALRDWASEQLDVDYRLYVTKDEFEQQDRCSLVKFLGLFAFIGRR